MRLTPEQTHSIKHEAQTLFGPDVQVRLFGSRVDDRASGGDLDLLVTSERQLEHPAWLAACLAARLQMAWGEQRIDVLVQAPNLMHLPIHDVAQQQGIVL